MSDLDKEKARLLCAWVISGTVFDRNPVCRIAATNSMMNAFELGCLKYKGARR